MMTTSYKNENRINVSIKRARYIANTTLRLVGLMGWLTLHASLSTWAENASYKNKPVEANQSVSKSEVYSKLPLYFEENSGQAQPEVKFILRGSGHTLFLTADGAALTLRGAGTYSNIKSSILRMKFVGANYLPQLTGLGELSGKCNYFIDNNPKKWRTNIRAYARVKCQNLYPGIDLIYYGNQRHLKYDLTLTPGTNPESIRLAFDGAEKFRLDERGDLVIVTPVGEVRQHKPVIYQEKSGVKQEVAGRYVVKANNEVGFKVASYDRKMPLVIDPVLSYSTFLGGSGDDLANAIAVDSYGNAYVTGRTSSLNFPTTPGAFQAGGIWDAFVIKLNPAGVLIYSTYLGGGINDEGFGIAVDDSGNAYVTGGTDSTNFPTTTGAFQTVNAGSSSVFVAKLNPAGNSLIYSTYLGGTDGLIHSGRGQNRGLAIAIDSFGNAYVTGWTDTINFPTVNALQATYNAGTCGNDAIIACPTAYVTKLNATGTSLIFSTYLGGRGGSIGRGIAVDSSGNVYLTGSTGSASFPTANSLQATLAGSTDAFVTKLRLGGDALIYSTYLGGSKQDIGNSIAVDSSGNVYITGSTESTDFPTVNPIQPNKGGCPPGPFTLACNDAFVTKLNSMGSAIVYSTYLGGSSADISNGIAVDRAGNAYITGQTLSEDFPTRNAFQSNKRGDSSSFDAFVSKLNAAGSGLIYSTYFGGKENENGSGIALDSFGHVYLAGNTGSANFPTINSIQSDYGGGDSDAFVARIAAPRIISASVKGKKLVITGEGFENGAVIILNGQEQKTRNDSEHTTSRLIAKKAGKNLAPGQTVTLQVRNPDGSLSIEFTFTRPVE